MVNRKFWGRILLLTALALPIATPQFVLAISCANGGTTLKVCIDNTNGPATAAITIHGDFVSSTITCSSASASSYDKPGITIGAGQSPCYTVPDDGTLLDTAVYKHRITVSGGQTQYQRVPVIYNPSSLSTVQWTYYAPDHVFTVNQSDDTTHTCPPTCSLRDAITAANAVSGSAPVLIQFDPALPNPTVITMTQTAPLSITRARVTIDGIYTDGNPWIVGDANAAAHSNQSPFARSVDLANKTSFSVTANDVNIQGLFVKNSISTGTQANDLFLFQSLRNVLNAMKIDAGNVCSSGQCACPSAPTPCPDVIHSKAGNTTDPGVTAMNVEGFAALDRGVNVTDNGRGVVKDGWFHFNLRGGLGAAGKSTLEADRNMVELNGRGLTAQRTPAAGGVVASADGLTAVGEPGGSPTTVNTDANVSRMNSNNGLTAKDDGTPRLNASNDYVCGNTAEGMGINKPATLIGTGIAAVYNAGRGVLVPSAATSGLISFGDATPAPTPNPGNNAFARNAGACDFRNDSTLLARANNNQWGPKPNGTPGPNKCGSGTVETITLQNPVTVPVSLDNSKPALPSNVFLTGQSVRVKGTGFNAIDGNPAVDASCVAGNPDPGGNPSCCTTKPRNQNVCGSGHPAPTPADPKTDGSSCVQFKHAGNSYSHAPVTSITPTTILAEIPADGLACSGGLGEKVRVGKFDYQGITKLESERNWCNNSAPKDQF